VNPAGKVLAYCVFERADHKTGSNGVDGQPIRRLDFQDLVALYSDFPNPRNLDQEDALRFHAVIKSVFDRQAIIPFRFPTFLDDEAALLKELRENYARYHADLSRLRDFVQMELRISAEQQNENPTSGKQYLEAKLQQTHSVQQVVRAVRESAAGLISDSKERLTDRGIRLYALIRREDTALFRARIQSMHAPAPLRILLSGPWPATDFLHE
jgi:hypothetical protein